MAKYAPDGDIRDQNYVFGYNFAMALEYVLKAAGNDLSRRTFTSRPIRSETSNCQCSCPASRSIPRLTTICRSSKCSSAFRRQTMGAFRGDLDDELTLLPIWKHVCFSRRIEAIGKVAAPICFSDHQMSRQVAVIWNTALRRHRRRRFPRVLGRKLHRRNRTLHRRRTSPGLSTLLTTRLGFENPVNNQGEVL